MVAIGGVSVVAVVALVGIVAFLSGAFEGTTQVAESDDAVAEIVAADSSKADDRRGTLASLSDGFRNEDDATGRGENHSRFGAPGGKWNVFVLNLSERERDEVQVKIDGELQEVPSLGPVMYSLSAGEHKVTLTRDGYDPIEYKFRLDENGRETFRPRWQMEGAGEIASNFPEIGADAPASSFDGWLQDFEAAQRRAQAEGKDIFIAFNGTDWCPWCVRLMQEVLFQKEFRRRIEQDFILVHIDAPRGREAMAKIHDRARNEEMLERFEISSFPTIVLTDDKGQAYAEGGYVQGGIDPFMEAVAEMQKSRAERDRLFAAVKNSSGEARIEAAEKALEWLRENGYLQHYGPTLESWLQLAKQEDPRNEAGHYEVFFEMDFLSRVAASDPSDLPALRPVLARLEKFNRDCGFQDGDRGGRLNLLAAAYLAMHEMPEEAQKFADAGVACKPTDPELKSRLRRAARSLANSDVIGSGTGFVIASGGYIMTNFHVIEEGKPFVRVPGREEPLPAKVIAKDKGHDIALLQVKDAEVAELPPLPISTGGVGRGAPVGVFGYPLGDAVGSGLKLTTGIISALADEANEGMLLLDCRVNPGNSGGPLCDKSGQVIGLVTAKSSVGFGVDSYGMARPAADLEAFLKENLMAYQPIEGSNAELRWDQVDQRVSRSVLMIVMKE